MIDRAPDNSGSPGKDGGGSDSVSTSNTAVDSTDNILGENLTEKVTVSCSSVYYFCLSLLI